MENNYEFVYLYPSQIKVDGSYQRIPRPKHVAKILNNWNDDLVNNPKVSLRQDGSYYVFDGQHTLNAWQQKYGNKPIQCKVFRGLTVKKEAELFTAQTGESEAVKTWETLRADYNFQKEDVVDMVKCCSLFNINIQFEKSQSGAVVSLYNSYKTLGHDMFINMLSVLNDSFYGDKAAFAGVFIKGMTVLFKRFGGKFKNKDMVNALKHNPAGYYDQRAKKLIGSVPTRYAYVFAEQYNKGRRDGNRLTINL